MLVYPLARQGYGEFTLFYHQKKEPVVHGIIVEQRVSRNKQSYQAAAKRYRS